MIEVTEHNYGDNDPDEGAVVEAVGCSIIVVVVLFIIGFIFISAYEGVVKMQEDAAVALVEKEAERHTIEGIIASVEQLERPMSEMEKRHEETKDDPGIHIYFNGTGLSDTITRVYFEDGRHYDFDDIYDKRIPIGEHSIITYNGRDRIVEIVEK